MQFRRLRLNNYGMHETFECDFHPGINGIVGPNGSGKSTILSALRFGTTGCIIGSKTDEITYGKEACSLLLDFEHGQDFYTIARAIGKRDRSALKSEDGSVNLIKVREIDSFMEQLLGTTVDALLRNVFIPQGAIDSILYATDTERLKEIQQITGLQRSAEVEKKLGQEISVLVVTPGLDELLAQATTQLKAAESELREMQTQLGVLDSEIQELVPFQDKLADMMARLRQAETLRQAEVEEIERRLEYTTSLSLVTGKKQELAGVTQLLQSLRSRYDVAKAELEGVRLLKEQMEKHKSLSISIAGCVSAIATLPTQQDYESCESAVASAQQRLSETEAQLVDPARRPKVPREHDLEAQVASWTSILQSLGSAPTFPNEVTELIGETSRLAKDLSVFESGKCPTCGTLYTGDLTEMRAKLSKLVLQKEALIRDATTAWNETKNKAAEGLQAASSTLAQLQALVLDALSKRRDTQRQAVSKVKSQRDEVSKKLAQRQQLQAQLDLFSREVEKLGNVSQTVPDVTEFEKTVMAWDQSQSVRSSLEMEVSVQQQICDSLLASYKRAEEHKKQILAREQGLPSEADIKSAKEQVEKLSARTKSRIVLLEQMSMAEVRVRQYKAQVEQTFEQVRREGKDRKWLAFCRRAREVLHVGALPALLMREYGRILNDRMRHYFELWDSDFFMYIRDEDLSFQVRFANGRSHSAVKLSGGQKIVASTSFRFAMSDTFARSAGFLILDEPSAYLDPGAIDRFKLLLSKIRQTTDLTGRQILLVTHEESLMGFFDHTIAIGR